MAYLELWVHVKVRDDAHFLLVQERVELLDDLHVGLQVVRLRLRKRALRSDLVLRNLCYDTKQSNNTSVLVNGQLHHATQDKPRRTRSDGKGRSHEAASEAGAAAVERKRRPAAATGREAMRRERLRAARIVMMAMERDLMGLELLAACVLEGEFGNDQLQQHLLRLACVLRQK